MTNYKVSSDFRARSFCCVLNNVDKLFDKKSDFFDSDTYNEKTKKTDSGVPQAPSRYQ